MTHYIQEKLVIKKSKYNYFPKTKKDLKDIIKQRIKEEGNEVDLNDIDVSNITDMSDLFYRTNFNGDISEWDVSNVKDMNYMFFNCTKFDKYISNWDVSNVLDMRNMFYKCKEFNQDISKWNVSNVMNSYKIFSECPIEEKYKPKFI